MTTWLNTADAAAYLGINADELRRAAGKTIPAHRLGARWRFSLEELDQHIAGTPGRIVPPSPRRVLSKRSRHRAA